MERKFHKFPANEPAVIDDDGVAQTIMLELGCWDEIAKSSDLSKNLSICVADSHPTHWCLCARHANNPDSRENGFQVIAYPKSSVDRLTVELLMQNYLKNSTELSAALFEPKPLDP